MAEKELKEFTADEVSKHTTQEDCWLVIGNQSNGKLENLDLHAGSVCYPSTFDVQRNLI